MVRIYAITWNGHLSKYDLYRRKKDAERRLEEILKGWTYDEIPELKEIDVK